MIGFAAFQPELNQAATPQSTDLPPHRRAAFHWFGNTANKDEGLLQLALRADAAHDMTLRQMDSEQFNRASLRSIAAHFVEQVKFLCKRGRCMTASCMSVLTEGPAQVFPHSAKWAEWRGGVPYLALLGRLCAV